MLDITSHKLEGAIDHLRNDVQKLQDREREHYFEICKGLSDYQRDIERLKTAVRQMQAALNFPQLTDED